MKKDENIDLRDVMVNSFINAVENGVNLAVLVSDSTSTSKIAPFMERYPDRLINVGIAEQNLIGVAVGMSLGGYVAITCNAAPFLIARSNEQIKNDVCYSETNVKLIGLNVGFCYGPLASTHHAIDDISIMRGFGNIFIFAPSDMREARQIFSFALEHIGPIYIRMDNAKFPTIHEKNYQFKVGEPDILRTGRDISIFSLGSVTYEAYFAAEELEKHSISAEVVNCPSIRPINKDKIIKCLLKNKIAITVEEHSVNGGLGSIISEIIAEEGLAVKVVRLGITSGQFAKAGPRKELRAFYKIDQKGIKETVKRLLSL